MEKERKEEYQRKKNLQSTLSESIGFKDLEAKLEAELKDNQQLELYHDLEMPLSFILADMESQGVKVDRERLLDMGEELKERLAHLEDKIYSLAHGEF